MSDPFRTPPPALPSFLASPRRWLLAGAGVVCVGLGLLGVAVPGLPTTVFLILASYLFTRSCPVLEERLLGIRVFRPYMKYVRGEQAMPRRARVAALAMMWSAIGCSLGLLAARQLLGPWIVVSLLVAGVAGTVMILSWRRSRSQGTETGRAR